jgi:hypothetical protein
MQDGWATVASLACIATAWAIELVMLVMLRRESFVDDALAEPFADD